MRSILVLFSYTKTLSIIFGCDEESYAETQKITTAHERDYGLKESAPKLLYPIDQDSYDSEKIFYD